ncbi:pirin family protein [Nonomuraea harbinensis]|uniref:Pirin family protein n=1 Tax=Nonomuraea harbinensis TaxID=1286938 RepID=A0ABW1BQX0_9ACTN|nr:pirin family protein [Nonomuraea harbinensis]
MSNLEPDPSEILCGPGGGAGGETLEGRAVPLGGPRAMTVTRTLPHVHRRMIGAWCFVDAYGPEQAEMRVAPHPHTGLQTVSWLVAGEVLHRDSLGSLQAIRPGSLNLMTAGRGISHSEESRLGTLHGVQLWVALPGGHREVAPAFEHHAVLPVLSGPATRPPCSWARWAGSARRRPRTARSWGRRSRSTVTPRCRSIPRTSTGCCCSTARSPRCRRGRCCTCRRAARSCG